jgi:hypothetical protein
MGHSTSETTKQRRNPAAKAGNMIVRLEKRPGQPPTFVPHRDADAILEDLRNIQLGMELALEDLRCLNVRVCKSIDAAKNHRDLLANLIGKHWR